MKYFKSSRRASKHPAASRRRRMKIESLEPRQMLAASDVIISEVMYRPLDPSAAEKEEDYDDEDEFEFVELFNRGIEPVNLAGWTFAEGFVFTFPAGADSNLSAGEHLLLVRNQDAVDFRYEDVSERATVFQWFDGGLRNGGEDIELRDAAGVTIALIDYTNSDPWPERADNNGSSLQIEDTTRTGINDLYRARNWIASRELHGAPGTAASTIDFGVVINEVLSNSDDNIGELDKIELYNTTETAIDIGGLFLTDKNDFTELFRIPDGTIIQAEGYVVFDETDFNVAPNPFALSSTGGETLSLLEVTGDSKIFIDSVEVDATQTSVSVGRLPNGRGVLFPLAEQSFGQANTLPAISDLVISEIHYNPVVEGELDDDVRANYEFIEILNRSTEEVSTGIEWRIRKDVDLDLPNRTLAAGERLLVLRFDPVTNNALRTQFENFYDIQLNGAGGVQAVGGYGGINDDKLSNSGGEIALQHEVEVSTNDFDFLVSDLVIYRDRGQWPNRPDGGGSSLEREFPDLFGNDPDSWRPSSLWNGSPGASGETTVDVLFNEILTHTDPPTVDTIELYNRSGVPVDVSGWLISDSGNNYDKFQIPAFTPPIQPGDYLLFDENDFNASRGLPPEQQDPNDFALSSARGETLWLLETDAAGNELRFADRARVDAAKNGESFGRIPNGDPTVDLFPNLELTLGTDNSGPRVGPLVISEIVYNPSALPPDSPLDGNDLEFVEIVNPTNEDVDLTEWHLDGGVSFQFTDPDDPNNLPPPILKAGEVLVVLSFNPTKADTTQLDGFRDFYGIGPEVQLLGGYRGSLANGGERLQLQRPDEPPLDDPTFFPRLLEDEIIYDDVAPWPTSPDGGGDSLNRAEVEGWGHDAGNWEALAPSPGTFVSRPTSPGPLLLAALSPTEVQLSWTDSVWEESYHVFQWFSESGWFEVKTLDADATSVTLSGRQPGATNMYKVEAHNDHGITSSDSQEITMPEADLGDAPASYPTLLADDGAIHVTIGPTLGTLRDGEANGQPTASADGDGADEDGVAIGSIQVGQLGAGVEVTVQNAPDGALLDAWIDFDGDGDGNWDDPLDRIAENVFFGNGTKTLFFDVPATAVAGDTYARFRLSTQGNLSPTGLADDGEVEDYLVEITPGAPSSPAPLVLTALSPFDIRLDWSDSSGEDNYRVLNCDPDQNSCFVEIPSLPAGTTGIPLTGFEPGTMYTFEVEAVNQFGTTSSGQTSITTPSADFGDAPDSYLTLHSSDGAFHVVEGPRLGLTRDAETDGQPSVAADGDGADDDGVTFPEIQVGQQAASVEVFVQGAAAKLDAWIDFDGDGEWVEEEQIFISLDVNPGINTVTFDVPGEASAGDTYARFRLSTQGGLGPNGAADDGEVEDYRITIAPADDPLAGDLTGDGAIDFRDLTLLLANWNRPVGAESGNIAFPDTTLVDHADLKLLLDHWTGPLAGGAPGAAQAVGDLSPATSAVFDQIGEESSSEDASRLGRSRQRRASARRGRSQQGRLQAVVVDHVMTGPQQVFSPIERRVAFRCGE